MSTLFLLFLKKHPDSWLSGGLKVFDIKYFSGSLENSGSFFYPRDLICSVLDRIIEKIWGDWFCEARARVFPDISQCGAGTDLIVQ